MTLLVHVLFAEIPLLLPIIMYKTSFNFLTPRRTLPWCHFSPIFQFHFKKGSSKKFPMSVAPMSR